MRMQEWLKCAEPQKMLKFVCNRVSDRKLRLFACSCCRRIWKALTLKPVRQAVEAAEKYAEGAITAQELQKIHTEGILAFTRTLHRNVAKMLPDSAYTIKMYRMGLAVNVAHDPPF